MELTHTFTVPVDRATAWAAFQDIASVAECFPGATVTSEDGDSFEGTVKVKLGPVALQYAGSGEFVERDASAYRMVIRAKGRDKRGNGTAGADVTASFTADDGTSTRVEVLTTLQITGKPAQFGRGVIQEVSDKLLGQFLTCLESRIAPAPDPVAPELLDVDPAGPAEPGVLREPAALDESTTAATEHDDVPPPAQPAPPRPAADDAIDLGTTVLPVLLRTYGKPAGVVLVVLLLLALRRRRRS